MFHWRCYQTIKCHMAILNRLSRVKTCTLHYVSRYLPNSWPTVCHPPRPVFSSAGGGGGGGGSGASGSKGGGQAPPSPAGMRSAGAWTPETTVSFSAPTSKYATLNLRKTHSEADGTEARRHIFRARRDTCAFKDFRAKGNVVPFGFILNTALDTVLYMTVDGAELERNPVNKHQVQPECGE